MADVPQSSCLWQHLLNHQRSSQILCLPCSDSLQFNGSKPMRGHVMGKQNGEASNGVTYPHGARCSVPKVTVGLKICDQLRSGKAVRSGLKRVEEYAAPSDNRRNYKPRRHNRDLVWCLQRLMALGRW
jgi:hypothetical protein